MNEGMEALAAAASGFEAALESAGIAFGFGIVLASSIDRSIGQTDHHAPDGPEHAGGSGSANTALIFAQSDIQAMVESAFHDPIATLEGEHPQGLELFQGEAAHQINDLPAPLPFLGPWVLAFDPALQASDQPGSWKNNLRRAHFQTFQASDLQTAAVTFPPEHLGLGGGPRGKNAVR